MANEIKLVLSCPNLAEAIKSIPSQIALQLLQIAAKTPEAQVGGLNAPAALPAQTSNAPAAPTAPQPPAPPVMPATPQQPAQYAPRAAYPPAMPNTAPVMPRPAQPPVNPGAPAPSYPPQIQQPAPQPQRPPITGVNYTLEQLAAAGGPLMDAGKGAQLMALLQKYGVTALDQLDPSYYPAVAADLRALGAQI